MRDPDSVIETGRPPGRPGDHRLAWVAAALVLVIGATLWVVYGRSTAEAGRADRADRPAGIPVEVATAVIGDVPIYLDGLGTVQAFNMVTIRSRVDGELVEIAFTEGQLVAKGDLIARIDPRPYQAALDQATAKKAQDEATLASTRLDLERTRELASRSFASQQQLDQQTATASAQAALIASDAAAIDKARTQLGYTSIRAPIAGRTGLRFVDQGNIVRTSDQTGIVDIAQLQPISVVFTAPERELGAIDAARRAGDVQVIALAPDGTTPIATGTLALINNAVDPASGTVKLKATFANADDRLWPGLSVNTKLLVRTLRAVVMIPADAVQRSQDGLFAYVVGEGDKVDKRVIRVGAIADGKAVVIDGLRAGERVVTAGQSRLQPGALVAISRAGPAGGERAADAGPPPASH